MASRSIAMSASASCSAANRRRAAGAADSRGPDSIRVGRGQQLHFPILAVAGVAAHIAILALGPLGEFARQALQPVAARLVRPPASSAPPGRAAFMGTRAWMVEMVRADRSSS